MARHNYVSLCGKVDRNPAIAADTAGNLLKGNGFLTTIRGNRNSDDGNFGDFHYDTPQIVSENPNIVYQMSQWKKNDIVEIKGTLSTRNVSKIVVCPACRHKNAKEGTIAYVTPVYCSIIRTGLTEEEADRYLKEACEISNQCIIVGNLCTEPELYASKNSSVSQTEYQIAINRKLRVKEDPPEMKTDYPWVKSFGENAVRDSKFLNKGSSVLIEGFLQSRDYDVEHTCEECKALFKAKDRTLEVVPYYTEYLAGCNSPEEIEKMENEEQQEIFNSMFA